MIGPLSAVEARSEAVYPLSLLHFDPLPSSSR